MFGTIPLREESIVASAEKILTQESENHVELKSKNEVRVSQTMENFMKKFHGDRLKKMM
jgi:hypothetical protein